MKKLVTLLAGLLMSFGVWADPAIVVEAGGNVCHIPLAEFNTGEEAIVSDGCRAFILEQGGEAGGICKCKYKEVPQEALDLLEPNEVDYENGQIILKVKTNYGKTRVPCRLEADGNQYSSQRWRSEVAYNLFTEELKMFLGCAKGQPQ